MMPPWLHARLKPVHDSGSILLQDRFRSLMQDQFSSDLQTVIKSDIMKSGGLMKYEEAVPMIQIIGGKKGSGKTKRLIDMTNAAAHEGSSDVIFLDDDNRYMFDIDHKVRFINAGEYHVHTPEMFVGFLSGMLSQNFDVGVIFIDAFMKLCKTDLNESKWLFEAMEELSSKHNVQFVLSVSADPDTMPDFVKKYLIA